MLRSACVRRSSLRLRYQCMRDIDKMERTLFSAPVLPNASNMKTYGRQTIDRPPMNHHHCLCRVYLSINLITLDSMATEAFSYSELVLVVLARARMRERRKHMPPETRPFAVCSNGERLASRVANACTLTLCRSIFVLLPLVMVGNRIVVCTRTYYNWFNR